MTVNSNIIFGKYLVIFLANFFKKCLHYTFICVMIMVGLLRIVLSFP